MTTLSRGLLLICSACLMTSCGTVFRTQKVTLKSDQENVQLYVNGDQVLLDQPVIVTKNKPILTKATREGYRTRSELRLPDKFNTAILGTVAYASITAAAGIGGGEDAASSIIPGAVLIGIDLLVAPKKHARMQWMPPLDKLPGNNNTGFGIWASAALDSLVIPAFKPTVYRKTKYFAGNEAKYSVEGSEEEPDTIRTSGFVDYLLELMQYQENSKPLFQDYEKNLIINARIKEFRRSELGTLAQFVEVEMDWVVMDMYEKELLVYPVMCKSQPFQRYYGGLTESFEDLLTESLLKLLASPELDELQSSMLALQQLESEKLTPISLRSATLQGKAEPANLVHAQATLILGERHGSACFISSDGHLLTTYGLIDTDSTVDIKCSNGALLKARVLRADPISNVALLQADTIGVMHVRPSSNSSYKPGEDVISISSPFDPQLSQSYSKGIISAVRNDDSLKFYQTDVRVSTGANGAPLLDNNGDLIGIINEKFIGTGIEGLSFAVSIHDIFERLKISYQP